MCLFPFKKANTKWSLLSSKWSQMNLVAFTLSTTLSLRWFFWCLWVLDSITLLLAGGRERRRNICWLIDSWRQYQWPCLFLFRLSAVSWFWVLLPRCTQEALSCLWEPLDTVWHVSSLACYLFLSSLTWKWRVRMRCVLCNLWTCSLPNDDI